MQLHTFFMCSILTIAPCFAEQTETHDLLRLELLNRQSRQQLIKKIGAISGSLAATGLLVGLFCSIFTKTPSSFLRENNYLLDGHLNNVLEHIMFYTGNGFLMLGEYLPLTAAVAFATYIYGDNNEKAIHELQKFLKIASLQKPNLSLIA